MRFALPWIVIAACSGDTSTPVTTVAPVVGSPTWQPIALTVTNAPLTITARFQTYRDEVPAGLDVSLSLFYDVTASTKLDGEIEIPTRLTCRLLERNVHIPDSTSLLGDDYISEHRTTHQRRIDLRETPEACEIAFAFRRIVRTEPTDRDPALQPVIATLCVQPAGAFDGPCPPAVFPRPNGPALALTPHGYTLTHLAGGGIMLDGGFTFGERPPLGRKYFAATRCENGRTDERALEDITDAWLQILPAGTTVAATRMLAQVGGYDPGRCELVLISHPDTVAPGGKKTTDKYCMGDCITRVRATQRTDTTLLGRYCLAQREITAGACTPALVIKPIPAEDDP